MRERLIFLLAAKAAKRDEVGRLFSWLRRTNAALILSFQSTFIKTAPLLRLARAMSLYEDAVSTAVKLPLAERERLAQALGLKLAPRATLQMAMPSAPTAQRPDAKSWREAERGHAVLDVGASNASPGPDAIRGMWAAHELEAAHSLDDQAANTDMISSLPAGSPVVVHTSAVTALTMNLAPMRAFWKIRPSKCAWRRRLISICSKVAPTTTSARASKLLCSRSRF